jgi:hypothetical protein
MKDIKNNVEYNYKIIKEVRKKFVIFLVII